MSSYLLDTTLVRKREVQARGNLQVILFCSGRRVTDIDIPERILPAPRCFLTPPLPRIPDRSLIRNALLVLSRDDLQQLKPVS